MDKPPNSPFPRAGSRDIALAPGGFGDLLGSGPRLSQDPPPLALTLGACRGARNPPARRDPLHAKDPLQVSALAGRTGQATSLTAEASVSSRIGIFHTQPLVLPNGGCTLVLAGPCGWGPNWGLLEDISRKGLGEGLSARPPETSGGRELQGAWRQASAYLADQSNHLSL